MHEARYDYDGLQLLNEHGDLHLFLRNFNFPNIPFKLEK